MSTGPPETAASVTIGALGYRARCTAPRCNKQARVIFRYEDAGGRPMSNSEFCSMHARARKALARAARLKVYDDRES